MFDSNVGCGSSLKTLAAATGCTREHLRTRSGTILADMSVLLWGNAEVFDWNLAGQLSTQVLAVAQV